MQHCPKWDRGFGGRIPTITLLDDRRFASEIMNRCSALKQFVGDKHTAPVETVAEVRIEKVTYVPT
jgi:hypothetical protein